MVTDINVLDNIVTLLSSNYTKTNADSITPTIAKIYTKPTDKEPAPGQDYIYVYSELTTQGSVGIGQNSNSQITEIVKIDIRVKPSNTTQATKIVDTHARKVLVEVRRVLATKIVNPDANFDVIDPNIEITDLSNGFRGIFRYVIKVRLIDYCRSMTA
ncbi:MAG: hypothetical protein K0A90_00140 [Methanosarcinaceae archaeon]|nr:hypothetical protein [Methanosarcinaceae archaeon]